MESAGESRGARSPEVSGARLKGKRDRLQGRPDHRHSLDGAGLLAGGGHRAGGGDGRRTGAGGTPGLVRSDVLRSHGLLLHEPRRPGLRHDVLVGDAGHGTVGRLDRGLGDLRDRHPGRRVPGRRGGPLHVPVFWSRRPRRLEGGDHPVRRDHHRRDDGHVRHRHRALGPLPGHLDHRPGRRAPALRRRGPGEGFRGHGPRRVAHSRDLVVLALRCR